MRVVLAAIGLGVGGLMVAAGPAWADSIDGSWCRTGGVRVTISGPSIVTQGGARVAGQYDRHGFTYVVPAGEAGAGSTVEMRLLGEYDMQSRSSAQGGVMDWRRCAPETS